MWRKRLKDLARGAGQPHEPLFAPLLFGVAAQLEAIQPDEMALNGTRIRKNVGELRAALGLETVFAAAPNAQIVAGLAPFGAGTHDSLAAQPQLAASLDAVVQWQADSARPVVAAALDGPQRYIDFLETQALLSDNALEAHYDYVGSCLASLVRKFAEAGLQALFIHDVMPDDTLRVDLWKSALGTACNVARFHHVPTLLVLDNDTVPGWPAQAIACPAAGQSPAPGNKPCGLAWPADPDGWQKPTQIQSKERVITTRAEVAPQVRVDSLLAAVAASRV